MRRCACGHYAADHEPEIGWWGETGTDRRLHYPCKVKGCPCDMYTPPLVDGEEVNDEAVTH